MLAFLYALNKKITCYIWKGGINYIFFTSQGSGVRSESVYIMFCMLTVCDCFLIFFFRHFSLMN